jgi:hypothetical protein
MWHVIKLDAFHTLDIALPLVASVYIMVRGFTNMQEGMEEMVSRAEMPKKETA